MTIFVFFSSLYLTFFGKSSQTKLLQYTERKFAFKAILIVNFMKKKNEKNINYRLFFDKQKVDGRDKKVPNKSTVEL